MTQPRAVLDLVPHGPPHLVDPVGDPLFHRQRQHAGRERREHRGIEMAAGRRDRVPGRHDPGAVDPARVDRLGQGHVQQVAPGLHEQAQVPDGGEAGPQRAAGVADRAQHPQRRVVLHGGVRCGLAAPAHQQVDLHVHQAGQQDQLAEVDDLAFRRAAYPRDQVSLDPHDPRPDDFPGVEVEQPRGLEREHVWRSPVPYHRPTAGLASGPHHGENDILTYSVAAFRPDAGLPGPGQWT